MERIAIFAIGTIAFVILAYTLAPLHGGLLFYFVLTWLIGSVVLFWKARPTRRSGLILAFVIVGLACASMLVMANGLAHGQLALSAFVPFLTAGWLVAAGSVLWTAFHRTA